MKDYILKRLLFLLPMLLVVSFGSFLLTHVVSGQPAVAVLTAQHVPEITEELIQSTNERYGFNDPLPVRYGRWISNAVRLNFGRSYVTGQDVSDSILSAFGYTLQLAVVTITTVIVFSLILGVLCALWEGRMADRLIRFVMFVVSAMPSYWIGLIFVWLFSVKVHWLPTSGVGSAAHFILPSVVLSIGFCGFYFRLLRNAILDNVHENYAMFFRASGVPRRRIMRHVLKNSLQTVVTAFFMAIPAMISGTVVIESIFAWPGLGRLCLSAIFSRDIPIIQAYVLLIAVFYCIFNILADIVNAIVNPRWRRA